MGRKLTYHCDTCQNEFGDRSHINLEGIYLRVAYTVGNGRWGTHKLKTKNTQHHFCNMLCLNEWLATHVEELFEQIGGGRANPTS